MKHRSKNVPECCAHVLAFLMLLDATAAHAADAEDSRADRESVTVTTSLITPFFGAYEVQAAVRASDAFGVLLNASYLSLSNDEWKTRTGTVGAGANYHFLGDALRRWYVEAVGELLVSSWRHEPTREVAPIVLGYSGMALMGYRFVCDTGPVLDVGAGVVALRFPSARIALGDLVLSSEALTRVYPAIKFNAGWAF